MHDGDALNYLITWLRNPPRSEYSSYGYEMYIPNVIRSYVQSHEGLNPHFDHAAQNRVYDLSPHFYAAAWELCRRGIIRPGVRKMGEQDTQDGSAGNGYSITPFGRTWLTESDRDDFVPTEPGRFAAMLKPFQSRLGPGFSERAQEAVRCYGAHAYLACCAMGCGSFAATPHTLVFQPLIVHSLGIRLFPQKSVVAVVEPWASLRIWPGDCVDIPVVRGNPSTRRNHH